MTSTKKRHFTLNSQGWGEARSTEGEACLFSFPIGCALLEGGALPLRVVKFIDLEALWVHTWNGLKSRKQYNYAKRKRCHSWPLREQVPNAPITSQPSWYKRYYATSSPEFLSPGPTFLLVKCSARCQRHLNTGEGNAPPDEDWQLKSRVIYTSKKCITEQMIYFIVIACYYEEQTYNNLFNNS